MRDARVPPQAEFQAGVFTRSQAYAAGWSNRQVRRRLEVGHWRVVAGAAIGPATLDADAWPLGYAVSLTSSGPATPVGTARVGLVAECSRHASCAHRTGSAR